MPIEFFCPGCGKLMRTPDETGGRKGQCPSCKTKVLIPEASVLASSVRSEVVSEPASTASDKISLTCRQCGRMLQVPSTSAGKKGQCPQCKAVMSIPALPEAAQPRAAATASSGQRWKGTPLPAEKPNTAGAQSPAAKIQFRCSHCQKLVRVGSSAAGKMGQCPQCKAVIKIPIASNVPAGPSVNNTGLTPLGGGLTPLGSSPTPDGSGLTPLDATAGISGLTPIDSTPVSSGSGLTPIDPGPGAGGGTIAIDTAPVPNSSELTPIDGGLTPIGAAGPGMSPFASSPASGDPFADLGSHSPGGGLGAPGVSQPATGYASAPAGTVAKPKGRVSLSFNAVLGDSWKKFTENLGTCVATSLIFMAISLAVGGVTQATQWGFVALMAAFGEDIGFVAVIACLIVYVVLVVLLNLAYQTWMTACMVHLAIETVKGKSPTAGDAFEGGRHVGSVLVVRFLVGLMMVPGVLVVGAIIATLNSFIGVIIAYPILLILSGMIWLVFSLAPYFVVGDNKNPIQALSLSAKHTMRILPAYLGVVLVVGLGVAFFGLATCMIGFIICLMLLPITQATVYMRVRQS